MISRMYLIIFKSYLIQASCFPVHLLDPVRGSVVLDMCAAPGMKATHVAAKLQNCGYAICFLIFSLYSNDEIQKIYETFDVFFIQLYLIN